ncbi:MAG TPA: ACP S-malonyltransferase [Acidobacteriota bacterium]|nr:ACP S-malonyltransferase [Acidobacteriota bacterium]
MKAFVFPGQGSQYPGMGKDVAEKYPQARAVFEAADARLGYSLSRLCFEGPDEELRLTEKTQPAILTVSVAIFRVLEAHGVLPDFVAGHSLGEFSALVAAGALEFEEAVELVQWRGRYMQEAVPVGKGAMSAVLGLDLETIEACCREVAGIGVAEPANLNSPEQVVIAGEREAVEAAGELMRARGARRVMPLPVSAPFHCSLMKPAEIRLQEALKKIRFNDLRFPLVNNADARVVTSGKEAAEALIRQVSSSVLWVRDVEVLLEEGVNTFIEVGPGKVLSGLIRKISPEARTENIENSKQVHAYVSAQ